MTLDQAHIISQLIYSNALLYNTKINLYPLICEIIIGMMNRQEKAPNY